MRPRNLPGEPLTELQCRVLELMAHGHTDARVGHMLGVTEYTVRRQLRGAFARLGAQNRTHAVALAMALQLIADPPIVYPVRGPRGRMTRSEPPH